MAACLLALPAAAGAATITVAATGDDDPTLTGENDNGTCTLREAIHEANANNGFLLSDCAWAGTFGDDTITLNAGTYTLDESTGSADDSNAAGDLDVETDPLSGSLTIDGAGAQSTFVEAGSGWTERVLHQTDVSSAGNLTVSELSISGGATLGDGGGIFSDSGALVVQRARIDFNAVNGSGGGIASDSDSTALSIIDSDISNNDATQTGGGISALPTTSLTIESSLIFGNEILGAGGTNGGGASISTLGSPTVTVENSIIQANRVDDGSSSADGGGLAIFNVNATIRNSEISQNELFSANNAVESQGVAIRTAGSANLDLVNSTVSGNFFNGAGDFSGGAINASGASVDISHSSFAENEEGAGGVLVRSAGTLNLMGSVVEPVGLDAACGGTVTSQGYNVLPDTSCGAPAAGDEQNADPQLGALQDNGGPDAGAPGVLLEPIRSHLPADTSPAVDHVPQANCLDLPSGFLTEDQRELPRPEDYDENGTAECDAGSVELQLPDPPAPPTGKCAGKNATIVGTSAGEVLKGTSKRDIVAAKGGKDTVKGLGGNDLICGGDGNDKLIGAKGKDTLRGDKGKDTLNGGAKKDTLKGGGGRDVCKGGAARDKASACETRRKI